MQLYLSSGYFKTKLFSCHSISIQKKIVNCDGFSVAVNLEDVTKLFADNFTF